MIKRQWGHYKILAEGDNYSVKLLVIHPGKSLSMQRHFRRAEYWTLVKGECSIENEYKSITELKKYKAYTIPVKAWHRPFNPGKDVAEIIEIWEGNSNEDDIERSQNPVSILHGV
tara:strand:- start:835 stop:1179 length:345 start_codon:yes stop_codon:yes gene_type:complete